MDYKPIILEALEVLRNKEAASPFKARAYAKVIKGLREVPGPIRSYNDILTAGVPGIGKKIEEKIAEIISTGHLEAADVARDDASALNALTSIYGIGPVKAQELLENGIRSVLDLRSALGETPGILNDKQKIGLRYAEDLVLRIPRAEMDQHAKLLKDGLGGLNGLDKIEIVGSYRRKAKDSGDIDVLLRPKNPAQFSIGDVIASLNAKGYIIETLAEGVKKFMGICRIPMGPTNPVGRARRLDILVTPREEYAYAVLYFTGSDKFNIEMRKKALELGYTMNEHGMQPLDPEKTAKPPIMKNEKDIFKFLNMEYVKPDKR